MVNESGDCDGDEAYPGLDRWRFDWIELDGVDNGSKDTGS